MSGRAYGKVERAFWTDPEMRPLTTGQKLLLLYYFSSPHGNMVGLYYAPFATVAVETGLARQAVKRWTLSLLRPWLTYDLRTQEVLVHNGARKALEANLHGDDKRRKAVEKLLAAAHSLPLKRRFLELYADWGLTVSLDEKKSPTEGASEALERGMVGGTGSSSSSRSSSRSREASVATQPGDARSNDTGDLTDGQLMGLVRAKLYVPDGKAPKGYHDGRDVKILRALRKQGLSGYQIADAIEGVRLMCEAGELGRKKPGEKLTMRALYNTGHGVRPLLYQAQEAYQRAWDRAANPRGVQIGDVTRAPEHISTTLERLVKKP